MRISTRGRYALRFMVDLAERDMLGYISLKDVAERQSISKKYLEQIVPILKTAGLLKTNRGYRGGYSLSKPADQINVADVLVATEGALMPVPEKEPGGCGLKCNSPTYSLWEGLAKTVYDYLSGITIADLVKEEREQMFNDYSI